MTEVRDPEVRDHLPLVLAVLELREHGGRGLERLDGRGIVAAARDREADVVQRQRLRAPVADGAEEVERRTMLLGGALGVTLAAQPAAERV